MVHFAIIGIKWWDSDGLIMVNVDNPTQKKTCHLGMVGIPPLNDSRDGLVLGLPVKHSETCLNHVNMEICPKRQSKLWMVWMVQL